LFEYIALIHGVKPNNTQNLQDNLVEWCFACLVGKKKIADKLEIW
jgi:hypothetical protein